MQYKLAAFIYLFHTLRNTPLSEENFKKELNPIISIAKADKVKHKHDIKNTTTLQIVNSSNQKLFRAISFTPHIFQIIKKRFKGSNVHLFFF